MDIKKMLFVTKFDDLCFDALQSRLTLRDADLDHVVFLNVIERDKVGMYRGLGYQKPDRGGVWDRPFERLLMAADWSPASLRAEAYIRPLTRVVRQVHVIHAAQEKDLRGKSAMEIQKLRKETRSRLEEICDRLAGEGIEARTHVYIGDPLKEVEKAARECQATMVVLGSSGKAEWAERWIGSVSRFVAEKSDFPTLIVPPEKDNSSAEQLCSVG